MTHKHNPALGRSVAIGSADSGNVSGVLFQDCTVGDDAGSSPWAFKIKMHVNTPSHVSNVTFRDCRWDSKARGNYVRKIAIYYLQTCLHNRPTHALPPTHAPSLHRPHRLRFGNITSNSWQDPRPYPAIQMYMNYGRAVVDPSKRQPSIHDISFINVTATHTSVAGSFVGASADSITGLRFEHCRFHATSPRPWMLTNVSVRTCASVDTEPPFPDLY